MNLAMVVHSQIDNNFELETDWNSKFILLVKEYTFIFDARDTRYKDMNLLERIWQGISKQLNLTVESE